MLKILILRALILACSVAGGWIANFLGMPLAWLIGALIVSGIFAFCGVRFDFKALRPYGLVVLGLSLGQSFTPAILTHILHNLPIIALCALGTLCSGILVAPLFSSFARTDPKTAFFCGVPGGVVLMAIQAQRGGASEKHVVLAQTVRLVMVVLIYPVVITFLVPTHAGQALQAAASAAFHLADIWKVVAFVAVGLLLAFMVRKSFVPNPWMIIPCFMAIALAAIDMQPVRMPHGLVAVCQIILGVSLGAQMTPQFILGSRKLLMASILSSALLTVMLVPSALLIAYLFGFDVAAVLLGMSPGGMPEMTVAATSIGAAVPLVLSFHLVRVLIGNVLIEPIWWVVCRIGWMSPLAGSPDKVN
jgi:membrane AbrB-like protein